MGHPASDHPHRGRHGSAGGYRDDDFVDRSAHHSRPHKPAVGAQGVVPTPVVILSGLPDGVRERDIYGGLDEVSGDRNMTRDQVRNVRIFDINRGGCEALVHFFHLEDAERFVDRHYPSFSLPLSYSRGRDAAQVTVDVDFDNSPNETSYHGSRYDEPAQDDDWECMRCGRLNYPDRELCHKCKAERTSDNDSNSGPVLTGETDEDPQQNPSQYLVVRDLEGSVTEEVLAKGITKLFLDTNQQKETTNSTPNKLKSTAPTASTVGLGARPGSLRRVFLMRDQKTNESWRYGFAEFATIDDARGAVAKFKALPKFTIASKPVAVGFIHTGVFIPCFEPPQGDNSNVAFAPVYNPSVLLQYWDARAYPSPLVVSTEPLDYDELGAEEAGNNDKASSGPKGTFTKKLKKDKDGGNKAIAMAPQMQMWAKKAAELHGGRRDNTVRDSSGPQDAAALGEASGNRVVAQESQPDGPRNPHPSDQYVSYADWENLRCLACSWTPPAKEVLRDHNAAYYTPEQLLIYHEVHAHKLYREDEVQRKASEKLAELGKEPRTIVQRRPRLHSELPLSYTSYADPDALHCHLCGRTFTKLETLRLHETESELHKALLRGETNIDRATSELKAKDKTPTAMRPKKNMQSQYRDRARERRKVFSQPKKPTNKPPGSAAPRKEKEPEPEPPKASKGAGMLAKMGWTSGSGLGAEGAGRTEAIATEAYAPGVGLGAEGGKLGDASEEAARNTKGNFSDFVEKTRDRARERFEKLD
ncbi:hypothetical protein GQ53DRAFT_728645 [Thozetella sp. PMI_491]|nr:hypothetical protein GQ53DRAFT_728645 [Thozetella sp. PMI_491]